MMFTSLSNADMKYLHLLSFFLIACTSPSIITEASKAELTKQLEQLNEIIVESALENDVDKRLSVFNQNPICMPDHQVSMQGIATLTRYHQAIFERQSLSKYQRFITDIYPIKNRIIEMGTYEKVGINHSDQTPFSHKGKYLNVWVYTQNKQLALAVETWNYDHPIEDIESILVNLPPAEQHGTFGVQKELSSQQIEGLSVAKTIMRQGVNERDGTLRATIYHDDGVFLPHDEPMMIGNEEILEHLIAYNSGDATIDSLATGSNWAENLDDYILESSRYYVEWQSGVYSGIGKGKGLRLWRKTNNGEQKILLNIGMRDTDTSE